MHLFSSSIVAVVCNDSSVKIVPEVYMDDT